MKIFDEETNLIPEYPIENIASLEDVLFFDIETTGLKKETTQVYLIGCGYFKSVNMREDAQGNGSPGGGSYTGRFCVKQWLTESALDEREVLETFCEFAASFRVLVHFNGDGFDIPYMAYKIDAYGMDFDFGVFQSFDIYKKIKPLRNFLRQYHLNQTSVESFLGIKRDDEMNGGLLIPYYFDYEKTGSEEAERLLLLHNHDDIIGMLKLVSVLAYPDVFDGKFTFARAFLESSQNDCGQDCHSDADCPADTCAAHNGSDQEHNVNIYIVIDFILNTPVKTAVDYEKNGIIVSLQDNLLQINLPVAEKSIKIPVDNYKDYYYLPLEDTVIHKDVASFVDKKYRCKATKDNAFLKVPAEAFLKQDAAYFEKTAMTFLNSVR